MELKHKRLWEIINAWADDAEILMFDSLMCILTRNSNTSFSKKLKNCIYWTLHSYQLFSSNKVVFHIY